MSDVVIDYLVNHLEHFEDTVEHLHRAFRRYHPDGALEQRRRRLTGYLNRNRVPLFLIALEEGRFIGTAGLVDQDMADRPELGPWLASLYTKEERRRRGVGDLLIRRVIGEARRLAVETLYLYTDDLASLYRKYGFVTTERREYRSHWVEVMKKELHPLNQNSRIGKSE